MLAQHALVPPYFSQDAAPTEALATLSEIASYFRKDKTFSGPKTSSWTVQQYLFAPNLFNGIGCQANANHPRGQSPWGPTETTPAHHYASASQVKDCILLARGSLAPSVRSIEWGCATNLAHIVQATRHARDCRPQMNQMRQKMFLCSRYFLIECCQ